MGIYLYRKKITDRRGGNNLCELFWYSKPLNTCNMFYIVLPLKTVQNCSLSKMKQCRQYAHITPLLCKLCWLPIDFPIQFNVLVVTHKMSQGEVICTTLCKTMLPSRIRKQTFNVTIPSLWNSISHKSWILSFCLALCKTLKTYLFFKMLCYLGIKCIEFWLYEQVLWALGTL